MDSRVWGVSEIRTRGVVTFHGVVLPGTEVPLTSSVRALQGSTSVYRAENLLGSGGFEQSMGVFGAET